MRHKSDAPPADPPRPGTPLHPLVLAALVAVALTLLPPLATASPAQILGQIEEEDLDDPVQPTSGSVDPAIDIDRQEILALYDEAVRLFESEQRPSSLPLFGRVVDLIGALERPTEPPASPVAGLDDELRNLWLRALTYRAELHRELGFEDLARQDLERLLTASPGASLDATVATPDLEKLFASVRRSTVGSVRFELDPPDAEVWVDGEKMLDPVPGGDTAADGTTDETLGARDSLDLLAGEVRLEIRRPGFDPVARSLTVEAGRSVTLEQSLERTSPVLRVATRPTGASVTLDGELLGVTAGTTGGYSGAVDTVYRLDQLSEPLVVDGLETGLRVLEVRADGYRAYRAELMIDEPIDYQMPPVVLEAESGQLIFDNFPAGATIRIDGEPVEPDVPGASRPRISLPPGDYLVTVDSGAARMDSTRLRLADRQTVEIRVALRPGLAFLGILGGDDDDDRRAAQALSRTFEESPRWTLIDRAPEGEPLLRRFGVTADALTALAEGGDGTGSDAETAAGIDWQAVQAAVDRQTPGLVYLVAVPSSDLIETGSTLWVWPAGPGPARPERLDVRLGQPESYDRLRALFDRDLPLRRPWVGALVVDSDAAAHPVVAAVAPASPAEQAGIRVGEQILGVAGVPVQSAAEVAERIRVAESGETIEVAVRGSGNPRAVRLSLGASPWASVGGEEPFVRAVAWARLVQMADDAPQAERWIVALDQALLLLQAGEADDAARRLRDLRAPQVSHGFGQATVDYWLGVALARVGPDYLDAAREALERAARVPGARMFHHDDAWVAPRARARLSALAAGIF